MTVWLEISRQSKWHRISRGREGGKMNRFERFAILACGLFWGIIIVSPVLMDLGVMPKWSYLLLWIWPLTEFFFGIEWCNRGPRWERKRKPNPQEGR